MDVFNQTVRDMFRSQTVLETFVDVLLCLVPIWLAVTIGLFIGWSWRPRWTGLLFLGLRSKFRFAWTVPAGFGARQLWFAFTAFSAFSLTRKLLSKLHGRIRKDFSLASARVEQPAVDFPSLSAQTVEARSSSDDIRPTAGTLETDKNVVTENDLAHLLHLLDGKDGEMAWQSMMERSTPNLAYRAWRYEAETGPVVFRSKTVFEDATPDLVRDFFWDDEFRLKWDPMILSVEILEECPLNGTMIVRWTKKFPFFCSDREYIIGRRIWEAGGTYYCVTKGVPHSAVPRRDRPRRVDLYFSSWIIKPVHSLKGDGQLSACEVMLVHYEDMGIPRDVAKLGVRHGMWGTVKKLHAGLRAYQIARRSEESPSRCALMARITTRISSDEGAYALLEPNGKEEEKANRRDIQCHKNDGGIDWRWVAIGGAAVAVGLHTGFIGKVLLVAAGHRAGKRRGN
ncbi:unnamed protein product [Coffea canephora]|uniref:START domain-containing protein n=1 Tax=Coffea canephora TaxID=49390 RepID=A0A068TV14_COFCA|nr:unnamed protein product [Coffea canephora]